MIPMFTRSRFLLDPGSLAVAHPSTGSCIHRDDFDRCHQKHRVVGAVAHRIQTIMDLLDRVAEGRTDRPHTEENQRRASNR